MKIQKTAATVLAMALAMSAAGVTKNWRVLRPKAAAISAEKVRETEGETVLCLPPLPAFGVAVVVGDPAEPSRKSVGAENTISTTSVANPRKGVNDVKIKRDVNLKKENEDKGGDEK